jgi:hypothetical protein
MGAEGERVLMLKSGDKITADPQGYTDVFKKAMVNGK